MSDENEQHLDLGSPIYPVVSHDITDDPSLSTASTPSTVLYEMDTEQELPSTADGTIVLSSGTESQLQSQQNSMDVTANWNPMAVSTPLVTNDQRSEKEIENELFHNIEQLVRKFLENANRDCPYYRVMRWVEGDDPKWEYVLTVVINRPVVYTGPS